MRLLVAVALVAVVAACGGSDATTTTVVTDGPTPSIIPDDPELRRNIYGVGINGVGTLGAPEESWIALAEAGCQQGAWDWGTARALGDQFLSTYDPDATTEPAAMAQTVWLMTILGCRQLFPQGAIERGPPPPVGP